MSTHHLRIPYVDDSMAKEAEAICAEAGLTLADAFRRLVLRTVKEKHVPLDLLSPNEETLEAMAELDRGEAKRFNSVDELMADLNAED